jgi:large subunit ribosomal protein L18
MKLKFSKHTSDRKVNRLKKKIRIRKTVKGTDERPRLCVFRSGKHMYAQIINDVAGTTATAKNNQEVVCDLNGYIYPGRVKSLAEGAREGGLNF